MRLKGSPMKILRNPLFLYALPSLVALVVSGLLYVLLPKSSFLYTFFFNSLPIQFLSTWLFLVGIFFWYQRFHFFKQEQAAFATIKMPDITIGTEDIPLLIKAMPAELKETLTLKRVSELLTALSFGEDIIRLSEELSRSDMVDVERGHLTLDILKNLIPVIGFLGTVVGLSLAMVAFPQVTEPAALKNELRNFAASLSVAFNTTLLALSYTIAIIMLTAYLRQREETLVAEVDQQIKTFLQKFRANQTQNRVRDGEEIIGEMQLAQFEKAITASFRQAVKEGVEIMAQKYASLQTQQERPYRKR